VGDGAAAATAAGRGGAAVAIPAGINGGNHTITFGPNNQNLFLIQEGNIFSTTGFAGGAPGTFTKVGSFPESGNFEGSAFLSMGSARILYAANESEEEAYGAPVTGTGSSIAVGSSTTISGEDGSESADTGEFGEFDEAEGMAILNGTPMFNDSNNTPMFATSFSGTPITVHGNSFPIVDAKWSGKTLLIANEEDDNLIALIIHNDGTVVTPGVALAETGGTPFDDVSDADAVAVTADGKFAYVHDEGDTDFYRFDLKRVDSTGGSSHIKQFDFTSEDWLHDGMVVMGNALYATADAPTAVQYVSGAKALFKIRINPTNGDLGTPQFFTEITDGKGNTATGDGSRLVTDGSCIYASDSGTSLIYKICTAADPAPALSHLALLACAALLGAAGVRLLSKGRLLR
jgi:hypothetical protein